MKGAAAAGAGLFGARTARGQQREFSIGAILNDPEEPGVGLDAWQDAPEPYATITIPGKSAFRLLQFTDVHFFCVERDPSRDKQTLEDLPRLVDEADPHVLLVTGDLWHDNPDNRGAEFMAFAIEQLDALGVPWLFTWGNHDQLDDYVMGHQAMHSAKHSLYRGGKTGGNYIVHAVDSSGEPFWELLCLNSMGRGLNDPQRQWLQQLAREREGGMPVANAFGVYHIPVSQYLDVWTHGGAEGVKLEGVASWGEDGTTFDYIKRASPVKACFVGHDHVNDYSGQWEGVELVYGRATGTGGYGTHAVPKGAKLITANGETGEYEWVSILPDGARWTPAKGMRVETKEENPWRHMLPRG